MSRYTILLLLNIPLVLAGIINAITVYKLGHSSRRRLIFRVGFWLVILFALAFTEVIYGFLFSRNLTQTEPLSLFDVIQITGIIVTLFIASQAFNRVDLLERRLQQLHQDLSIRLSKEKKRRK